LLIPKKNRNAILSYLFKEGVLVCKKDHTLTKHSTIEVPHLHIVKLMLSLESRGFVKTQFSWQYFYYTLTDKGIEYLRDYLHVSAETVPATHKKASKPQQPPSFGRREDGGGFRGGRGGDRDGRRGGGRGGYRGPGKKFDDTPSDSNTAATGDAPSGGRGGRGRGRGRGGRGGSSSGSGAPAAGSESTETTQQ